MRRLREDHGDWEVIASFRSKPFCVGSVDDVEEDLIDLMNSNETAFRQIVNYLRDVGYAVNSDDFDADDYAEWFTRELHDEFTLENEDELEFGYFNFKMKVFHNYYESIRRLGEDNSSLKLKKVKTGKYTTTDGKYEIEKSDGFWYAVDSETGQSVVDCENSLSAIKDSLESYIKSHGKKESFRRLREGDASLKTNYAVIVYDMNTGSYNLYTGTKKMCEQLYKDLFDFNIDDYDDDEKEDMYDWLYRRLNEFNCIERIDFRRGIDYRDNYSDGYNKYHIINYTKPRHPISLYL